MRHSQNRVPNIYIAIVYYPLGHQIVLISTSLLVHVVPVAFDLIYWTSHGIWSGQT